MPISKRTIVAFSTGFAAFLPVGAMYLAVICLGLNIFSNLRSRLHNLNVTNKVFVAVCLYGLIIILSSGYTLHIGTWSDASTSRLFHSTRVALLIVIGLLLIDEEKEAIFRGFLVGSIFCVSIFLINSVIALPDFTIWRSMLSVTGNASSQKMLMLACVGAIFFSYFLKENSKIGFFICAGYFGVVFVLGLSRNAQLVAILLSLLILLQQRKSWLIGGLLLGSIVVFSVFLISDTFSGRILAAINETGTYLQSKDCSGSVSVRLKMWSAAFDQMLNHVFTGTGLGSWNNIWPTYSGTCQEMSTINNPHNDFLLAGMELGIFGFITIIYLYMTLLQRAFDSSKITGNYVGIIFTSCLIITSIFNAPLRDAALGMALVLFSAGLTTSNFNFNRFAI